jgi:hypothetical protein
MPYLLPQYLELGLRPSKLVWGGSFAGFKLFVSGIPADKDAPCIESSRAYESRQCARNARDTRSYNTVSTEHGESNARTNSKVRADFCELLEKSAFTREREFTSGEALVTEGKD